MSDAGVSRRAALIGAAAGSLFPAVTHAADPSWRFGSPPWEGYRSGEQRDREAARLLPPAEAAGGAKWRDDMDHSHLAGVRPAAAMLDLPAAHPGRGFRLTPGALAVLLAANSMGPIETPRRMDGELFLFALRGCVVADPAQIGLPLEAVDLSVAELDHLSPRCVLGVWRRRENRLAVFSGSTVPNRHAMALQARAFARARMGAAVWRIANVLPTGRHDFVVGDHGGWHPAALRAVGLAGSGAAQPALRSSTGRLAWRDLVFDPGPVMDNIHPAVTPENAHGAAFSSYGCLTVAERRPPRTWTLQPPDWRAFSTLAEVRLDGGRRIHGLALLTGAEAWLASQGAPEARLRHGSTGPAVTALRHAMGLGGGDVFDIGMLRRWVGAGAGAAPIAPRTGDYRFAVRSA